ncbi:TPA: glycerophosphodiester phosphodiesterase, partial [Enterococcus faecium]
SKVDWSNAIFAKRAVDILKKYGVYKKSFFVISDVNQRIKFNESYPDATLSWLLTDENLIDSAISEAKKYQRALLSIPLELATEVVFEKLR